jgi:ketosteroid isomerase-like protein
MHRILIAFALAMLLQGTTTAQERGAQEKSAVMAPVHQFVDAFNKGDAKTAAALCATEASIIDEFPPHEWIGAGACTKWMSDYDADAKKEGVSDGSVTLGTPRHVDITADRAYVVVPADYTFKQKGKVVKETGSMLTIALRKGASGWRIVAWAWTEN